MAGDETGNNNRTHEPSLRELTAELDGFRDYVAAKLDGLDKLLTERDRRYTGELDSRDKAVGAAFEAQKELFSTVQSASKEAVSKAEEAQRAYNERSNEFRGALDDSNRDKISRQEFAATITVTNDKVEDKHLQLDQKVEEIKTEIQALREYRSKTVGQVDQVKESRADLYRALGPWLAVGLAVAGWLIARGGTP